MKTPEQSFENPSALNSVDFTTNKPAKTTKLATILRLLVNGKSLNRFEAEHHHDHCLHSTVSTLQNEHAITIERKFETVRCNASKDCRTRVCRYWLGTSPENIQRARVLLAYMEHRK
jgi:hypothetical protein